MDLRVHHPDLKNSDVTISDRTVRFDEQGISPSLFVDEYDKLCGLRGYVGIGDVDAWAALLMDATEALPDEGECPFDDWDELDQAAEDEAEDEDEDEDEGTLFDQFERKNYDLTFYNSLPLAERLQIASDHRLTECEARVLFDYEGKNKGSKRCLSALDRRITVHSQSPSATDVTKALVAANFPRWEEQ